MRFSCGNRSYISEKIFKTYRAIVLFSSKVLFVIEYKVTFNILTVISYG